MWITDKIKGLISNSVDKATTKVLRYIISCVIRCSKHPLEHRKWCKENPKAMELVDSICEKAMEAKRGRVARREGPQEA